MAVKQEYIDIMVNIPGFSVGVVGTADVEVGGKDLMIGLIRRELKYRCHCGREFTSRYDSRERCVSDLPFGPWPTSSLVFWQARVDCPDCGIVTEELSWVGPRVNYTKRLAASVALACRESRSLKSIARQYRLHVHTVKKMDQEALERDLPDPSASAPRLLGVDEFSLRKGHHYATVVADLETVKIPYVAEGRDCESLAGYYRQLGPEKCERIEAVAMDMWPAFAEATREHCPQAEIVYDPFHLISAFGRDVIDVVRAQEYSRAEGEERRVIKGGKYLLLKNKRNLEKSRNEPARLRELLRLNQKLSEVYVLKDDLKQTWRYRSKAWAEKWLAGWNQRAMKTSIEPLKKFARKLKRHLPGILAHCRFKIHTGLLEGMNNKIKVIKRVSYGFGDMNYFFLKIRGAFQFG